MASSFLHFELKHSAQRWFFVLLLLGVSLISFSATVPLYVGESYTIFPPDPVSDGYISNVVALEATTNLYVEKHDDCSVTVTCVGHRSGSSYVKLKFYETYWGTYSNRREILEREEITYYFTTKYPTIKPLNPLVKLKVGETKKLEYKVTPDGLLEPNMNWDYLDYYGYSRSYIELSSDGYVTGKKKGKAAVIAVPYGDIDLTNKYGLAWDIVIEDDSPTISADVKAGTVEKGTKVTLTSDIENTEIFYTIDGTTPSRNSTKYTQPIVINTSLTLKARGYVGNTEGAVFTRKYTVSLEKIQLVASPSGGEVSKGTIVYINSSNVPDADIYYTLDGSNPTKNSNKYKSWGITINEDCTLKAIAYKDGYDDSNVLTQIYVIEKEKIRIDATNFPDANFRKYLLEQYFGKDGAISEEELAEVKTIDVAYRNIENLKGIEFFTALTFFNCSGNKLNALDVSKNTALQYLGCSSCQLTELNVSRNTAMTRLDCSMNKLTSLDVSNNYALTSLDCYENIIKGKAMDDLINSLPYNYSADNYIICIRLNPSVDDGNVCTKRQAAALKAKGWVPYCSYYNPENPYGMSWREYEGFDDTAITIDATNFPDANFRNYLLEQDYGKDGILSDDELISAWRIDVRNRSISSLKGIEFLTELYYLDCGGNQLVDLDLSQNAKLGTLYAGQNQLTSLDVSNNKKLTKLSCNENLLTNIDLSQNLELTDLSCGYNQLTSLDVSKNLNLIKLYCYGNQLTSLDISKNTAMEMLHCAQNKLSSLDVSNNTSLKEISCYKNQIKGTEMDVLINSLPQRNTNDGSFKVVVNPDTDGNVLTADQVAAVKAKGWIPYCYKEDWVEYVPVSIPSKLTLTFTIMNNTEEVVNLTKIKLLLNSKEGVIGVIMTLNDSIPYISIPPGETRRLNASMKGEHVGETFVNSELLEQLGYKSNVVLYDENNSTTTYVPEMIDSSKLIEDGKKFAIIINQNTSGINTPSFTEESRDIPIFNLNGQRMDKPRKGINIIGGKKVLIRGCR